MGTGVWIGPPEGTEYERWCLYTSACATVERRARTTWLRLLREGVDFHAACAERDRLHPFPERDASESELRALVAAYPEALAEYRAQEGT